MIWKHPKYVEGSKFNELFDSKNIFGARARSEYSTTYAKNPWFLSFHSDVRVGARRARKCARAKNFFRIEKFMKFATFYVFWMFSYLLNWLMWVPLKCVFFQKNLIFFGKFSKFSNFPIFWKKSNLKISIFKLL